jgi:hypothetical protein
LVFCCGRSIDRFVFDEFFLGMSRITSYQLINTNCCHSKYSILPFYPLHSTNQNRWTDGHVEVGLAPDDGDLKKCQCGSWFLQSQAMPAGVIHKPIEYREETWDLKLEAWLRKKKSETTQEAMERLFRVRPKNFISVPSVEIPPFAKRLEDGELINVIESDSSDINLLIVARRRYWRYLNHPYRESCRNINLADLHAYPAYEPSAAQKENVRRLIFMLEAVGSKNRVEIAELYRELGAFGKAVGALDFTKDETNRDVILQRSLIREKFTGPVQHFLLT